MVKTAITAKRAGYYTSGTAILWGALIEFGIAQLLKASALGLVEVVLTLSDIQVALLVGFGEFLSSIVVLWTRGPTQAVRQAWSGEAFAVFGPAAPLVVLGEIILVSTVAYWGVRRA